MRNFSVLAGRLVVALAMLATTLVTFGAPAAQGQTPTLVSISDITITEGNGTIPAAFKNALITFSVTGPRNGSISVDYTTVDVGSATPGVDYREFSQTVVMAAGQSQVTRAIRVFGGVEPEPTETLEVHLSNPQNVTIDDGIGVVTIIDNDGPLPGPTVSVADATATETDGSGSVNVNVTLSEGSATPVTVQLTTADSSAIAGSDYVAFDGQVTFAANQTSVSQAIGIVGDTEFESTESFNVTLSNPVGATVADGVAVVTINDNDPEPPGVPDLSVSDETVGEGDGTVTVTVTADETSPSPVTFDIATAPGTGASPATAGADYTAVPATGLTLPANTLSVTQQVSILQDNTSESPETFNVVISNVVGGTIADGTGLVTINDDDAPACTAGPDITIGDVTVTEGEFTRNAIVTFTRSESIGQSTRFFVETIAESATENLDYLPRADQLIVIQGGQLTKTLAFKILGDTIAEPVETFRIRAYDALRGCIDSNNDSATVTILDNDGDPVPSVSVSDASTTETDASSTVNVVVSLSGPSLTPVTVQLNTSNGSATGGDDFVAQGGTTVTIPAGNLTESVPITIVGDDEFEFTETFGVNLASPSGATLGTSSATVTIFDDEDPPPAVSVSDASTTETDGSSTVDAIVSLDELSTSPVTVLLSTADGSAVAGEDYVAVNQQLVTIPANTPSVLVALSIIGDDVAEPTEEFTISLSTPTNAIIGTGTARVTIDDDEPAVPFVSIADATTTETDAASTVEVVVSLNQSTTSPVTVDLATADGSAVAGNDYVAQGPTTVTFAPGDTSETISIGIVGDTTDEPTEEFTVNLSGVSGGVITDGSATVTIADDDLPACSDGPLITVQDVQITEGDAFEKNVAVTFEASFAPVNNSARFFIESVDQSATAPSDYTARADQLMVIAVGATTKSIVFKIKGDLADEVDETFAVRMFNPTRACIDPNNDSGTVTILNDDGPPVPQLSIADVSQAEGDTNNSVDVTVSLNTAATEAVTVQLSTMDDTAIAGSDYVAEAGATVTIPAGQTSVTQAIGIIGDTEFELQEDFKVLLSSPTGATIAIGTATVTIENDDDGPPLISVADVTVDEDDVDVVASVVVNLDKVWTDDVQVQLTTSDGTATEPGDYTAVDTLVTVPAGQTSINQNITIIGDDDDEGNETINVTLTNPVEGLISDGTAVVTVNDDDGVVATNPQLSILDVTVVEGDGTPGVTTKNFQVTFQVTPGTVDPGGRVTFLWETVGTGSATEGIDYPYARSTDPQDPNVDIPVIIPMPDVGGPPSVRTRTLKIYGDNEAEVDETFEVHIFDQSSNVDLADGIGVVTIEDNDGAPEISVADVGANEGESVTVTFNLDRATGQQVDFQVDTQDGSAVAPGDYTAAAAQTVSFAPNTTVATLDIPLAADGTFEGAEDFTVNLSNPVNATIADNQAMVTIFDIDTPPQISIGDVSVIEGDDTFKSVLLSVILDKPSTSPVDVVFATTNGTATGGTESPADFQRVNGATLTFDPGQTIKTVSVKIFGDTEDEVDEQFTVDLSGAVNAGILDGSATVTIVDNDQLSAITIDDLVVLEGDGNTPTDFVLADATINLDVGSDDPITVQVDSADGSAAAGTDYEAITAQTVTFPANTTTATIPVKVFSNDVLDGNRDFVLNLSNPTNAGIGDNQATVTIDDNEDLPKLSVADLSVTEGDGSAPNDFVNADVTVSLDSPAGAAVTVELDTTDGVAEAGADYEALTAQTVTIPAGILSVTQAIKVFGDIDPEPDEDFTVTLSNQSANADLGTATATVTIVDNEVIPTVSIGDVTVTEGDTGFQFAVFNITLSEPSNLPVSVELDTGSGSATSGLDYEAVADQIVTINPGATAATAFVRVFGDFETENTEDVAVNLSNPVNATIGDGSATLTILDQDVARQISIADASVTEGDGAAPADFVTLDLVLTTDLPVAQTATVELTTANGSATAGEDYEALAGTVATFAAGTDTTTASVKIFGDDDFEGSENFTVSLANAVGGVIADGSATVTIVENDFDPGIPNLRVEDIFVTEGDANQSNVELVFVLEQASDTTIRATATMEDVTATSGAGAGDGDYVPIIDLPLVFQPGERILKRVVKINGDTDYEGNETARILLTPNTTNTTADDANIVDNEGILTILDSEVGPGDGPQIFISDVTQQEGGNVGFNNVEVTFILDEPSGASVFFDVAAADGNTGVNDATLAGGDYQDPTTHLVMPFVFPPGQQVVKKNFRVNGDTELEGNEVFRLLVQNPVGGVIGDGEGIVTILDTDIPDAPPTVNVMDVIDGENGDVGTENATVKFFLDRPYDQTVTVQYQPVDGTLTVAEGDYNPNVASPTVVFNPGEQVAEKPVIINRDNVHTGAEFLRVQISNPTGGATIGDGEGTVTIYDDEPLPANLPGIFMTRTDIVELNAGQSIANLKGYIDRPFEGSVTATFELIDGTAKFGADYTFASGAAGEIRTITWNGGEQVSETKAWALGDNFFEGNQSFQLNLLSVTGDAQIIDGLGDITILDNDDENDPPEPVFEEADIEVEVSADVATANGGDTVVYTVDVTNNGPDDASNVDAELTLPTGLTLVGVAGCANTGTTCTIGALASGLSSQFTVTATVDLPTSGVVTATATASTTAIDSPQSNNTDSVDVTAISPFDNDIVYVSSTSNGNVNGLQFNDEDILAYDRSSGQWSMFFDGSDEGLINLDGFTIVDFTPGATVIELSMLSNRSIGALGVVDRADIIRFTGTTGVNTSGTWEMVVDGSDISLASSAENVDAITALSAGDLGLSTTGNLSAPGFAAKEHDVVRFSGTTGSNTSGSLSLEFDGSTTAMTTAAEDINAAWADANGDLYLSTVGNLNANGFTADFDDIVIVNGSSFTKYFDGDIVGFGTENIDGIHVQRP